MPANAGHSGKYMEKKTQGLREVSLWTLQRWLLEGKWSALGLLKNQSFWDQKEFLLVLLEPGA